MGRKMLVVFSILLAIFSLVFAGFLIYRPISALLGARELNADARSKGANQQNSSNNDDQASLIDGNDAGQSSQNGDSDDSNGSDVAGGYDSYDGSSNSGNSGGSGSSGGSNGSSGSNSFGNPNGSGGSNGSDDPDQSNNSNGYSRLTQPEVLFQQYIDNINERNFEDMYALLSAENQDVFSFESFKTRNSNIYDGIGATNVTIEITGRELQSDGRVILTYSSKTDSTAGEISFVNQAAFSIGDDGNYHLEWSSRLIFPLLTEDDRVRASTLRADRGTIYDRNGNVLAGNGYVMSVGIVPGRMSKDSGAEADKATIANLLGITEDSIDKRLSASYVRDDTFVSLKTLDSEEQDLAAELNKIPGVQINDTPARVYPLGEKAAHLTGYIQTITESELKAREGMGYHSTSLIGKTGLESIFEGSLRAVDGCEIYIMNSNNEKKQTLAKSDRKNGENIRLTINSTLQSKLYDIFSTDKSCSVAMDPVKGEVLALVSNPSYNPNDFVIGMSTEQWDSLNTNPDKPLLNRFRAASVPGSSFKPVTGAIGVTTGRLRPDENLGRSGSTWQKDSSWGAYTISTLSSYSDTANLRNALAYSDNIYFAKAALLTGSDEMAKMLLDVGFAEQIPFEYNVASSSFSSSGVFTSEIQLADSGYGQGQILVNPVHLASVYTAFVNDGSIVRPSLVYSDGSTVEIWKENIFTHEAVEAVRAGLLMAVEKGTARNAKIRDVTLAGKTGTAEIKQSKDDVEGTELGWFALFTADRDYPKQLLIIAMVEDVKGRGGSQYVIPKVTEAFSSYLFPNR